MFRMKFRTDNAAFDDDSSVEVARILRAISRQIEQGGEQGGVVRDVNGNTIGEYSLEDD